MHGLQIASVFELGGTFLSEVGIADTGRVKHKNTVCQRVEEESTVTACEEIMRFRRAAANIAPKGTTKTQAPAKKILIDRSKLNGKKKASERARFGFQKGFIEHGSRERLLWLYGNGHPRHCTVPESEVRPAATTDPAKEPTENGRTQKQSPRPCVCFNDA